jgi:hypothetical protein
MKLVSLEDLGFWELKVLKFPETLIARSVGFLVIGDASRVSGIDLKIKTQYSLK